MVQYAQYNSAVASPSPVLGWYDTDEFNYPNLPAAGNLLTVTEAQWAARLTNPSGWAVSNGALIAYTPPIPAPNLAQQAATALASGLAITSTSTPALNATYPCDTATQSNLNSMYALIQRAGGNAFPGGLTALPWPTITPTGPGTVTFNSATEFLAMETAVGDYVLVLNLIALTGTGTLPPATATIL